MTRGRVGAVVALALAAGLALRLVRLDVRPMHHDEANQAVKFGALLERGEYRYDPHDHHGPTLYYLTLPAAALRGQSTLASLDEHTLRGVTAAFGAASLLLLPLLSAGIGRIAVATSAWLLALSPAMVFYSRMFIQESLFACFTFAFLIAVGRVATGGGLAWSTLAGATAGLAVATKETSLIVLPAVISACAIAWWSLGAGRPPNPLAEPRGRMALLVGLTAAAAVAALFYSSFLAAPAGVLAPFRGLGAYLDRGLDPASHAHPWHYYFGLLAYSSSGGLTWSEGLVLLLAIVGGAAAWWTREPRSTPDAGRSTSDAGRSSSVRSENDRRWSTVETRTSSVEPRTSNVGRSSRRFWPRYLTSYVVISAAIFSAIPYKTPWNLLPFYVGLLVLAGIGFARLIDRTSSRALRAMLAAGLVVGSAQLGWQAWRASVTYASDPRNPYVYAQTSPDAVRMATRIRQVAAVHTDGAGMQVSVIASPYEQWPLPWYLRTMPHVGYWSEPGDVLALQAPVIVSSMDHTASLDAALGERYISEFYGLRPEVLLTLYIERGLWDRFLPTTTGSAGQSPTVPCRPARHVTAERCGQPPAMALWRATSAR